MLFKFVLAFHILAIPMVAFASHIPPILNVKCDGCWIGCVQLVKNKAVDSSEYVCGSEGYDSIPGGEKIRCAGIPNSYNHCCVPLSGARSSHGNCWMQRHSNTIPHFVIQIYVKKKLCLYKIKTFIQCSWKYRVLISHFVVGNNQFWSSYGLQSVDVVFALLWNICHSSCRHLLMSVSFTCSWLVVRQSSQTGNRLGKCRDEADGK